MKKIEVGDYILARGDVWEIINIEEVEDRLWYDIQIINQPADFLEDSGNYGTPKINTILSRVSESYVLHLGEHLPKDSEKAIKILFGNSF